ncbi:MAG: glycosyltransferase [Chloroflexi bacterium]|nr:glycosyltransferase [Chloroflexota bacterium]
MSPPLASIIIPCYNATRFMRDALDSALAQDYAALEIIVVNDGSTDDFETGIAAYRDHPRVKIVSQENRGLSAARNRGIREAHGEYLKFLDADDWLAKDALSKQVAVLQTQPALGFVYCDVIHVDAAGKPLGDYSVANARRILNGDILPSLLVGGYFTPNTVLVPRRVLDHVGGFDETLTAREDYELWLRIVCEGYPAYFVPEKLVYYRRHGSNMTNDAAWMAETHLRALDKITTRYPHRVAAALHELIYEQQRVDRDSAWARATIAAQQQELDAMKRALNTRGVRAVRALEKWRQHD